ncbi:MAG TPA: tetratricopeptide repeat protein [Steroidobacteraceae bacterium]|nr:tetratricopeptide repeat protein [Steroidobacteraceae bacterium]
MATEEPAQASLLALAETAYAARELQRAAALCSAVPESDEQWPDAQHLLGLVAARMGNRAAALEHLERAAALLPDLPAVWNNRGNALRELGRASDALMSHQRSLELAPGYAPAHIGLGAALQALGRLPEALANYERAIELAPQQAEARNNRAVVLHLLGRLEEALREFGVALTLAPDYASALLNRGVLLRAVGQLEEASQMFDRAVVLAPRLAAAWINQGMALQELQRGAEALTSLERAAALEPRAPWLAGNRLLARLGRCVWEDFDRLLAELSTAIELGEPAAQPFAAIALTESPALQRKAAETWVRTVCPPSADPKSAPARANHERIRVGYFSADFHQHATAHLAAGLFEHHDRQQFEVIAFSFGPDCWDDMRRRLMGAFDRFLDVRKRGDAEIALVARELGVDIAVDLKGFTKDLRTGIFAARAAPVQVSYLGYPGTMGAAYIDYLIADQVVVPPGSERNFTEKIVYLPHSYQINDRQRRIAEGPVERAALGLPADGFVFCCFNQHYKITPRTFALWMRLLTAIDGSVLWLLQADAAIAQRLWAYAAAHGIPRERLVFAPQLPPQEHLARYVAADLFLDTYPYGAHTTASDALWAGLPVLTRCGDTFASRVAASLLTALGLPELITESASEYEQRALALVHTEGALQSLRAELLRRRLESPLFDTAALTRHLEQAYRQMHSRACAGLPAAHLWIRG